MKIGMVLFFLFLTSCGSMMRNEQKSIERESESRAYSGIGAIDQAAISALANKTLWLKPPKLNDCEYDTAQFPVFSKVEVTVVTTSVAQATIPTFRIHAELKRGPAEGSLEFTVFSRDGGYQEKCFYDFDPKKKYKMSTKDWGLVAESQFRKGFSPMQLELSLGKPEDINKSATSFGAREQWVYDAPVFRGFIYFDNGKLTNWQN